MINYLNKILNTSDVDELITLYENQDFRISAEEILALDSIAREKYMKTYIESFAKTKTVIDSSLSKAEEINYKGKVVKIIDAPKEFSMLVHSSETGFTTDFKQLVNDSYIDSWYNIDNPKTHGLATSFITEQNLGMAPVKGTGVIYGFYDLSASDIYEMGPYDLNSHIANYGFETGNTQVFISADNASSYTRREYNEFVVSRADTTPSCIIIYTDMNQQLLDNAYKAASEWDIPIIRIDKTAVANAQMNQVTEYINQFETTRDVSALQAAIDSYESGKSGFSLNETSTSNFEFNNNSDLKSIYDSKVIENSIDNYIQELTKTNASSERWEQLHDILLQEQQKYEIANKNKTPIPKTASTLDINKYLTEISNKTNKTSTKEESQSTLSALDEFFKMLGEDNK